LLLTRKSVYMSFFRIILHFVFLAFLSVICNKSYCQGRYASDSLILLSMVQTRQLAMKKKDIPAVMKQLADDATFVNPGGYFYANKKEIQDFLITVNHLDTITYNYSAGNVDVRMLDGSNALIYYPWEMDWYNIKEPDKILYKEFGLSSVSAQKRNTLWLWVAVTDQHVPDSFEELFDHKGTVTHQNEKP